MRYIYYVVSLAQLSWICHVMLRYMYVRCSCRSRITELFLFFWISASQSWRDIYPVCW